MSTAAAPTSPLDVDVIDKNGQSVDEPFVQASDQPHGQPRPAVIRPVAPQPKKPRRSRAVLLTILALILITGVAVAVVYFLHSQHFESTDDAMIEARVIPMTPQVSARVKAVNIQDNQLVHKGDVLVELDPTDYAVALEQATASESSAEGHVAQAKAQVDSAKASLDESKAEVVVAQANADTVQNDLKRYQEASQHTAGAISQQQLTNALSAVHGADAQVAQQKAKMAASEAQIATAEAALQTAQADLEKARADVRRARVNLSYCTLTAPEDGRITRKSVEAGSYVQTGQSLFALVSPDCWIVANFKETQLDRVRPGQPVTISVDAYPGQNFNGHVDSIQSGTGARFSMLPPENATGNYVKVVQRVPVKIVFDGGATATDPLRPLAPGMSVVPEVTVR